MDMKTLEQLDSVDEAKRAVAARDAYIRWRMADVPAIYTALMPTTYYTKELWTAEKAIRAQIETDLKHLSNPWRQVGPRSNLMCADGLSGLELLQFAIECERWPGLDDAPKRGREAELRAEIAAIRAARGYVVPDPNDDLTPLEKERERFIAEMHLEEQQAT